MRFFYFLFITTFSFGQNDKTILEIGLKESFNNIVISKLDDAGIFEIYEPNSDINPFYLRGHFSNDSIIDVAIFCKSKYDNVGSKTIFILLNNERVLKINDNFDDIDYWSIKPKLNNKEIVSSVATKYDVDINVFNEYLLLGRLDSVSTIIIWNGNNFLIHNFFD